MLYMWLAVLKPGITYKYVVCEGGYAPIAKIRYKMPGNERVMFGVIWYVAIVVNVLVCFLVKLS